MDSNKKTNEFKNEDLSVSSMETNNIEKNDKNEKCENHKLKQKYLDVITASSLFAEESIYSIENLFEMPSQMYEGTNASSYHNMESNESNSNLNCPIIPNQADKLISTNTIKHKQNTRTFLSTSGCSGMPLLTGMNNKKIKINICKIPKAQISIIEDMFNIIPPNNVVMIDLNIPNIPEDGNKKAIELGGEYDNENNNDGRNINVCNTENFNQLENNTNKSTSRNRLDLSENLQEIPKESYECKSYREIPQHCMSGCDYRSTKQVDNSNFKTKICNTAHSEKTKFDNIMQNKFKNISTLTAPTFENILSKSMQIIKNLGNNNFHLKIYNSLSNQVDKLINQLKCETKNEPNVEEKSKLDIQQNPTNTCAKVAKSIQCTYNNPSTTISTSGSCKHERIENENPNLDVHIKVNVSNATPNNVQSHPSVDSQANQSSLPNNSVLQRESGVVSTETSNSRSDEKVLLFKTTQNCKLIESEIKEKTNDFISACPKVTKRSQFVRAAASSSRQRQLELHQLKIQVERKRLELLDLKLAREWQELQRQKMLFEKFFFTKTDDFI